MTTNSKNYYLKYHFFRSHISPNQIEIETISSENNLEDV